MMGEEQAAHFYGWLRCGLTALRSGKPKCGQVVVLAGEPGAGKSLLQNILTQVLGGRSAKPYAYMSGSTQFNAELFCAEHLMIEDEVGQFDLRVRREFGANLKAFSSNLTQRCHAKNQTALTLEPLWRISISLNEEPESMSVLPPLDESLEGKMMLLRCARQPMPMPTETPEQQEAFRSAWQAELPMFINFLLSWVISDELRDERYGVKHYHHPDLVSSISSLSPESKLLELIDTCLWAIEGSGRGKFTYGQGSGPIAWEGKASELEALLTSEGSDMRHEARKLMSYNTACGQYLARLMRKFPERFTKRFVQGAPIWTIQK
jgi:energy-coupling factor transporter ATP-binding protein EcfA2